MRTAAAEIRRQLRSINDGEYSMVQSSVPCLIAPYVALITRRQTHRADSCRHRGWFGRPKCLPCSKGGVPRHSRAKGGGPERLNGHASGVGQSIPSGFLESAPPPALPFEACVQISWQPAPEEIRAVCRNLRPRRERAEISSAD